MEKAARAVLTHGRLWYRIDAKGQRPGRLASSVASILMGK
jgi:ribosomal protein L13